jgi:integrator complex subunit 2
MLHFLIAFSHMQLCPSRTGRLLRQLLSMPATDIWPYAETIIKFFRSTLDDKVPRYIQGIYF